MKLLATALALLALTPLSARAQESYDPNTGQLNIQTPNGPMWGTVTPDPEGPQPFTAYGPGGVTFGTITPDPSGGYDVSGHSESDDTPYDPGQSDPSSPSGPTDDPDN